MGSRWEREGQVKQLVADLEDFALAHRVGAVELNDVERLHLLLASARVVGEMSRGDLQVEATDG